MKIIMTAGGLFWDPSREVFEEYKEDIIVIQLDKRHKIKEEGFKVIWSDTKISGLGSIIDRGLDSPHYKALLRKREGIEELLNDGEYVIVLGDSSIESLYIFKVLQQSRKNINLHLWSIKPLPFDGKNALEKYNDILSDLTNTKSITVTDVFKLISKGVDSCTLDEFIDKSIYCLDRCFAEHICDIECLDKNKCYFYDYHNEKFIFTDEGLVEWENNNLPPNAYILPIKGLVVPNWLLNENYEYEEKINQIKQPIPRVNGKEVCKQLKQLRKAYADANRIPYFPEECYYEGPCAGTCINCDEELAMLAKEERQFELLYPQYEIKKETVISKEEVERLTTEIMGYLLPPK